MNDNKLIKTGKIRQNENILALKVRTESNGFGVFKTLLVIFLILLQMTTFVLSYLYLVSFFQWYFVFSIVMTIACCFHALSSNYHGQAKATWVLFLLATFSFGYIFYFISDKRILFARSRKKINKILNETKQLRSETHLENIKEKDIITTCKFLDNIGNFPAYQNSKTTYYSSGASLFDEIISEIQSAKEFIFMEYFIISDGVLLKRLLDVLKQKAKEGVEVKIIYDDMGSHKTLSRKTKKEILGAGIELKPFNRLVPMFNIALNLRNHRKIVVVDGRVSFTGGANLADEYINEKRMHGYWKDEGIKIEGQATDSLSLTFLTNWKFLTNEEIDYNHYLNKCQDIKTDGVVVPFFSAPNYNISISHSMILNQIASAKEKLYIMTPYFIPDETITNMIITKAISGVDVKIILPGVADKKFVYIVSRNNVEKLEKYGVKIYTMTHSFVHSKVVLTENSAIVGSINIDLRSFFQQFESAVFLNQKSTLKQIENDFDYTISKSEQITKTNTKRKNLFFRILAGIFNLISPFM